MNVFYLIVLSLFCLQANAQKDSIPSFKNQGEQEDFWAKELFRKDYKKKNYTKFGNPVTVINENTCQFGSLLFSIPEHADSIRPLFTSGIIYPALFNAPFGGDASGMGNIKELPIPELPPTIKRFSCWISRKGLANPIVYVFELTNEQATRQTDLKTFIMGASLTFLKQGSIII